MGGWTHIREALANIMTAKLRSFLAILGVLVGTGSVVALISSSQLATEHALAQFKALGTNILAVSINPMQQLSQQQQQERPITLQNIQKVRRASNQIVQIAPYTNLYQAITVKGKTVGSQILGATGALADIVKIKLQRGRFISILDGRGFYAVIGSKAAKKMQDQGIDPLGKQVRLGEKYFTVVGIAKHWEPNLFLFADIDDGVIVPLQSTYLLSKNAKITNIMFRLVANPDINLVQEELKRVLKAMVPNYRVEFRTPQQIINIVGKQRQTFTWLLGAIGGIALMVGGIGVMNIMLVSVVERRREIGIRMAIGARRSDILRMFLIESIILTVFGGLLGILCGVIVSYVLVLVTGWQFYFYLLPPALGFVVSVFVGMLSGFYPAMRASRLDPIQTLQGE